MKNIAIIAVVLFTAVTIGCTAMNTQAPADESAWQKSAGWLPVQVMVQGEDGKKEVKTQRAPLDFNTETRMFRLHVEPEKPVDVPAGEKAE